MKKTNDYKRLVYEVFDEYFIQNSFHQVKDEINSITFRNKNCIFRFTVDYSNFDLIINSTKDESFNYNIRIIYLVLIGKSFDTNFPFTNGEEDRLKMQLKEFLNFLNSNLKGIADGDFSWSQSYLKYFEKEKTIHKILWDLDVNSSIYQKFQSGDLTWKDDIIKLSNIN